MPAAFAHDLYGRLVYRRLRPEIRQAIHKEKDCFYLGLHGPDILFFYRALWKNAVNRKGYELHEAPAAGIFNRGLTLMGQETDRKAKECMKAYLLGFACHYALDHSLHTDINRLDRETPFTHGEIETELERRLLVREQKVPLRTSLTCHVKNTKETRMAAASLLILDEPTAGEAILSFKTVNRVFINASEPVKEGICLLLKAAGKYEEIHGMIMRKTPVLGLSATTDRLEREFYGAIPFGVMLLENLFDGMETGTPLTQEFNGNFEGETNSRLLGPVVEERRVRHLCPERFTELELGRGTRSL